MPSLDFECTESLDDLYSDWCHVMDDHSKFSTNDSVLAHAHHNDLVLLAAEVDEMVVEATKYRLDAWNAVYDAESLVREISNLPSGC